MATEQGKGRMALIGTVILALGGALGSMGTIAVESIFATTEREAIELAARRTEVYLNFLKFKIEKEDYAADIKNFVIFIDGLHTSEYVDTLAECRKLARHEKSKWSEDLMRTVGDLCDKWRDARSNEFRSRDKMVVYGSAGVMRALAKYERKIHYRFTVDADEAKVAGEQAANSYVGLLLAMRKDSVGQEIDRITIEETLAVICSQTPTCIGYEDQSFLEGN